MGGLNLKITILHWILWWAVITKHHIIKDKISIAPNIDTPYYETHSNYYETLVVEHSLWKGCCETDFFLIRHLRWILLI